MPARRTDLSPSRCARFPARGCFLPLHPLARNHHCDQPSGPKSSKDHRVKFNKPRKKRVYTKIELQILRARMAVARAAKKGYQQ